MESLLLSFGTIRLDWHSILLSFLLAFALSSLIAIVYERTFQGLSYSRNLLQAMVLGSLVSCLIMIAIGNNIARGIGIVGSLAIIRFRTNLRDPRDLIFLFASLGVGVASGVQSYVTAATGAVVFCLAALVLAYTSFGTRRQVDGLVRFQIPSDAQSSELVGQCLRRLTRHFALVTMREIAQGTRMDYAYQVKLADPADCQKLIAELGRLPGIQGLTFISHETTVEV